MDHSGAVADAVDGLAFRATDLRSAADQHIAAEANHEVSAIRVVIWTGDECANCDFRIKRTERGLLVDRYRDLDETCTLVEWFWTVVENFTPHEKVLFLRFISGRSRLPANIEDLSQRFQVNNVFVMYERTTWVCSYFSKLLSIEHCTKLDNFKATRHLTEKTIKLGCHDLRPGN